MHHFIWKGELNYKQMRVDCTIFIKFVRVCVFYVKEFLEMKQFEHRLGNSMF